MCGADWTPEYWVWQVDGKDIWVHSTMGTRFPWATAEQEEEKQLCRGKHSLPEHVTSNSTRFQTERAYKHTLCHITFIPATGVNEALLRAEEGHLCICYVGY